MAGAVTAASGSATAGTSVAVPATSWARTDSRAPRETITTGDAIVGAWRDSAGNNRIHLSKSYFTFDLAQFRGATVSGASFVIAERAANDCAKPRATEAWVTTSARPTWADQPSELTKLPGPGAHDCVWSFVEWSATAAVRQALAKGRSTISFVLRMSGGKQADIAYGRTYDTAPNLQVDYNRPPDTPTNLSVTLNRKDCATPDLFVGNRDVPVLASMSDPDGLSWLSARFAFWPVSDPAQRQEVVTFASTGEASASYPPAMLRDGGVLAWAVRGEDSDGGVSAWSPTCQFTLDWTGPSTPPTVRSETYPEEGPGSGGEGIPGEFTFTANGVADVVGFSYGGLHVPHGSVAADRPGGSATVSITPTGDGPSYVEVYSVDRAGNTSDPRLYRFFVPTGSTTGTR